MRSGWIVAQRPLYSSVTRIDSFDRAATVEQIAAVVTEIRVQSGWSHGVWGFLDQSQLMELTQDTVNQFIGFCWSDSPDPLLLPIHFQEVFAEIDGKHHPLEVRGLLEDAVFHAIDKLARNLFPRQEKRMYWWDGQYVEFAWESRRSFFQTSMSRWTHLRTFYFCLEAW